MVCCSLIHRGEQVLGLRGGLDAYVEKRSTMGIPLVSTAATGSPSSTRRPGEDLLAWEPMTAPTNALVSGEDLKVIGPGESYSATFSVRVRLDGAQPATHSVATASSARA